MAIRGTTATGRVSVLVMGGMLMAACGGSTSTTAASLTVGTSNPDGSFNSVIADNAMVKMQPGSQGGCHLWLAFKTTGLKCTGANVSYTLTDLDMNNATISSMSGVMVDFAADPAVSGGCTAGSFKAFMLMAKSRENHHVNIDVTVTDSANVSASKSIKNVQALWPDPVPGQDRSTWCGTM